MYAPILLLDDTIRVVHVPDKAQDGSGEDSGLVGSVLVRAHVGCIDEDSQRYVDETFIPSTCLTPDANGYSYE